MEKLSKELAEKILDDFQTGRALWNILEKYTEKTPEEELAEYKCPLCGKARLYDNGSMIICGECDCGLGSTVDYAKKHACYQPDWQGGKV